MNEEGNYNERMSVWRNELLNDKEQHEATIKSNYVSIELMQQSNVLHKKQIEFINSEIELADNVIAKQ